MIKASLTGDREVIAHLQAIPASVRAEVTATIESLGHELEQRVQSGYLQGPRPTRLGVRTGRLIHSIPHGGGESRSRTEIVGETISYYVGTNVPYGAFWEFGFSRRIGAGARGGPNTLGPKAAARYVAKHPPGLRYYPPRTFLAPALADLAHRITGEIEAAAARGIDQAMKP